MKTQHEIILRYLEKHKLITPAKMGGMSMYGATAGSELTRRCRELRGLGILGSLREVLPNGKNSKFVSFYLMR